MSSIPTIATSTSGQTLTDTYLNSLRDAVNNAVGIGIGCSVYNTAGLATTGSLGTLTFNSERYDTDTMHDTVTNPSRITIVSGGLYVFGGTVEWPTDTGRYHLAVLLNGSIVIAKKSMGGTGTTPNAHEVVGSYQFAAGDYIELQAASSASLTINATGNYSPVFWAMHC